MSIRFIPFLVFLTSSCYVIITIKTCEPDNSGLIEATVQILKSCYGNRVTPVGLAGNSTWMISERLWSQDSLPVALIDADAKVVDNGTANPVSRHKLQVFVVTASTAITLMGTLRQIKSSIWWNHMAAFFVLDLSQSNHGCTNAFEMLWAAWEMNILNAKLMCHHRVKGRLIYTFNPYTDQAPVPWQLDNTYSGMNDHPWTLFVRGYGEGEGVCNELDFEKTNNLGGYQIRVSVTDTSFGHDDDKSGRVCVGLYDDLYCNILFAALNATPKVLVHRSANALGYVDDKGNPHGILGEVFKGLSDVGLTGRYLTSINHLTAAYPHRQSTLRIVTQYRGYKSQLSKICAVVDISSRFGLFMVCLINILFFKYFLRQSVTVAHLSTLRIVCNSSLPTIPRIVAPRIYLGSLFLFALTFQGIYQGQLASVLTKEEPLRNVNTKRDLAELGHTIYGYASYRLYLSDPEFKGRYVATKKITCTEYVLSNPGAACVADTSIVIYDVAKFKLHMSRGVLAPIHLAFPIRPDWPLENRFNKILQRSVEAHRIQYLLSNVTYKAYRLLEFQKNEIKDQGVKILTLEELSFVFAILGIGLGCATVSFVIESGLRSAHPRIVRTLNRLQHQI